MGIREGPHMSECTRLKGEEEKKARLLKGKVENVASLHLLP